MGAHLTPAEISEAAKIYQETGNLLETARRTGRPESTLRMAFKRLGLAKKREIHARAIEAGIRKARKGLTKSLDLLDKVLTEDSEHGPSIEPRDIASLLNARARAVDSLLSVAQNVDRTKQARLTREKTKAEIELLKKKASGEVSDVVLISQDDRAYDELVRAKFGHIPVRYQHELTGEPARATDQGLQGLPSGKAD